MVVVSSYRHSPVSWVSRGSSAVRGGRNNRRCIDPAHPRPGHGLASLSRSSVPHFRNAVVCHSTYGRAIRPSLSSARTARMTPCMVPSLVPLRRPSLGSACPGARGGRSICNRCKLAYRVRISWSGNVGGVSTGQQHSNPIHSPDPSGTSAIYNLFTH